MKVKQYFCKQCGKEYQKYNSTQKTCSDKCLKKLNEIKEKEKKKIAREKKAVSITVLKSKLWKIISEYIRRKDADNEGNVSCVTCWMRKHWKEMQAGHFVPSWSSSYLRYVEDNIHPQCYHCNINLGSNPIEYRIYMVNRYGEKFVEQMIACRNEPTSLKSYDLQVKIEEWIDKLYTLPPL